MESKLVKVENGYVLMVDNIMHATDNDKLSLKNCQAIENGYDLDELTKKEFPLLELTNHSSDSYIEEENLQLLGHRKTYIKAFQKAQHSPQPMPKPDSDKLRDELIQSLQQTEWDVEIETIEYGLGNDENGRPVFETRNILDADGCLILKRKWNEHTS